MNDEQTYYSLLSSLLQFKTVTILSIDVYIRVENSEKNQKKS